MPRHPIRLQRRHFELIADILANGECLQLADGREVVDRTKLIGSAADLLARTNPQFNRVRFLLRVGGFVNSV